MGCRHLGYRFSETELDERVLRYPPVTPHREAHAGLLPKGLNGPQSNTNRRCSQGIKNTVPKGRRYRGAALTVVPGCRR